ncbi:hypothetical protein [Thermoplasma acidophilum]
MIRRLIHFTNLIERMNREIRRRIKTYFHYHLRKA